MRRPLKRGLLCSMGIIACFVAMLAQAYPREEEIARGRDIMRAGDCLACHTDSGQQEFAGNRPIQTPFGIIYSSNITQDRETGIGAWSQEQFYRALHDGIRPNGQHLYPAMPFTYYTHLSRSDVDALFTFMKTVEPVRNEVKAPSLMWPLGWRSLMTVWSKIFFDAGQYQSAPQHSASWNRGAYLVTGAGHCGACHTEKNFLGADKHNRQLQGGEFQSWYAPMLIANQRNGLGDWTQEEIVDFLSTGTNGKTAAFGPMAEVITDSTSKMNVADLNAMAEYLKSLPTISNSNATLNDNEMIHVGGEIFAAQCSACHQENGEGVSHAFALLQGNANVQQQKPDTLIHAVLTGVRAASTQPQPTGFAMPAFDWKLNDAQIAAVLSYVRNSWGNAAPQVTASQVRSVRAAIVNVE